MFWRILKKDLKRKKTMNVIMLLFVILSSMFAAASVNNVTAVNGGIDRYFELADVPDAVVSMHTDCDADKKIENMSGVTGVKKTYLACVFNPKSFKYQGKEMTNFINPAYLLSENEMSINYFDENDKRIESVEKGCIYCTGSFSANTDMKPGDIIEFEAGSTKKSFRYMGRVKCAIKSNDAGSSPNILMNSEDFDELAHNQDLIIDRMSEKVLFVNTDDVDSLKPLEEEYDGLYVSSRDSFRNIYFYDMIAAYILMAISIMLMITAFIVLRFTIGFTISEEFREIGVMKAVGIANGGIRGLYIVKYLAIAVVGALIGFAGSIPLSNMMLGTLSENMVFDGSNNITYGIISSVAVIAIIMFFCYTCTRRVNKLSPIDAVRNGQTGERFGKRSVMSLSRSKLPSTSFMSINDVLSAPRRFAIIILVFALLLIMLMMMSCFALTLKSDNIKTLFLMPDETDVQIMDVSTMADIFFDSSTLDETLSDVEDKLRDNNIPGRVSMSIMLNNETKHGDKSETLMYIMFKGNTDYEQQVIEGYKPKKENEVSVTSSVLERLDAEIGDTITAEYDGGQREYIITGVVSSFASPAVFLCKDYDYGKQQFEGTMGISIDFDGAPDKATIEKNVEKLKDILNTEQVYTTSDYIKMTTGMSDTLNSIKHMLIILTVIIVSMIVVLMERSFISKEKSEIALMKAVGISGKSIVLQHTLRFALVAFAAVVLSLVSFMPISNVIMNWICAMIGDVSDIRCDYDPTEIFAVFPAILVGITVIGAFLTALYTRTIKSSDTASIE